MCSCIPARYVVAAMCFSAIMLQYILKVDLSVVIVAMVHSTPRNTSEPHNLDVIRMEPRNEDQLDVCPVPEVANKSHIDTGEFDWDEETQGYTLSAYYYGYVATQLLGGRLSEILGSKVVLGPGVFLAGLFTLLSPLAARLHVAAFIATRVLVGAASGIIIPSMYNILSKWFTVEERTFIASIVMSSIGIGTVISMMLSGILAEAGGWPVAFYIFGGVSMLFIVPWFLLMYNTPEEHPWISDTEKDYILSSNGETSKKKASPPVPWVAIFTSVPLWAHISMGVGYGWVGYTMLSELPTYLSKILHFNLQASGVLSSLPYFFASLSSVTFGYLSQWLRTRGYISKITAYQIFNGISALGTGGCLVAITFMGCNSTIIVALLVGSIAMWGIYQGGSFINHVDLGNNFAGTTAGISYTVLNSMGIFAPSITGILINGKQTLSQWAIVFYISATISLVTWILYMLFGSADEQPWNKLPSENGHEKFNRWREKGNSPEGFPSRQKGTSLNGLPLVCSKESLNRNQAKSQTVFPTNEVLVGVITCHEASCVLKNNLKQSETKERRCSQ
ncbi:hypothetical protein ANN_25938 [Periplaneta americana]|uniref:Major facilitator superfamily (MFS) profile domain-containing protein n=1 Tax=Periplaneta americana TaxID=6978 RepID=A0ABQ8S4Y5_PERAM|nr:hypothetical protein ANN_25938 [Periplaneta americana]